RAYGPKARPLARTLGVLAEEVPHRPLGSRLTHRTLGPPFACRTLGPRPARRTFGQREISFARKVAGESLGDTRVGRPIRRENPQRERSPGGRGGEPRDRDPPPDPPQQKFPPPPQTNCPAPHRASAESAARPACRPLSPRHPRKESAPRSSRKAGPAASPRRP